MTQQKKYEFVEGDTIQHNGRTLRRIRAIVAIGLSVASGELGGYIESDANLSQVYGNAWVSGDARVYGNARVYGDARVYGNAWVYGNALVSGNARVYGNAQVENNRSIFWASKVGTENGTLTAFKNKDGQITLVRGCFIGTIDEFKAKSGALHDERTKREYELLIEVATSRILRD